MHAADATAAKEAADGSSSVSEENALVARLFTMLRPGQRAFVEKALADDRIGITGIVGNPDASDVIARIYAIRSEWRSLERQALRRRMAALRPAPVTFVLVEQLEHPAVAAKIGRPASAPFANYVLLVERDLSAERVAAAVETLQQSRLASGDIPEEDISILVQRSAALPPVAGEEQAWADRIVEQLRSAPVRTIAGVGTGRALDTQVQPAVAP